jgi:pSer/pThr/pTyr-binding forkhead associated (FHA) protein
VPALLQIRESEHIRFIVVDELPYTIGRSPQADLIAVGRGLSPKHAEITLQGNQHLIHDTGSRLGTFVNGDAADERPLVHGDRIRLGDLELVFMVAPQSRLDRSEVSGAIDLGRLKTIWNGSAAYAPGASIEEVLTLILDEVLLATTAEEGFVMLANADGELECSLARFQLEQRGTSLMTTIPREVFATGKSRMARKQWIHQVSEHHANVVDVYRIVCIPLRALPKSAETGKGEVQRTIGVLYFSGSERSTLVSALTESAVEELTTHIAVAVGAR